MRHGLHEFSRTDLNRREPREAEEIATENAKIAKRGKAVRHELHEFSRMGLTGENDRKRIEADLNNRHIRCAERVEGAGYSQGVSVPMKRL